MKTTKAQAEKTGTVDPGNKHKSNPHDGFAGLLWKIVYDELKGEREKFTMEERNGASDSRLSYLIGRMDGMISFGNALTEKLLK